MNKEKKIKNTKTIKPARTKVKEDKDTKIEKKVLKEKKSLKSDVVENKKDYFSIVFVSVSIFMFFVLLFSLVWFKNSLFRAKDLIELEKLQNERLSMLEGSKDPLLNIKSGDKKEIISPADDKSDPVLGERSTKKLKLFYFSDFDCAFCFEQEKIIKNIFEKYSDRMFVVWKDYPNLADINGFSYQAARAARCAQKQDNFWAYSDLLYKEKDKFDSLKNDLFLLLAEKANLNLNNFISCLNANSVDSLIESNIREAESLGVLGIPYIYINDKDFLGNLSEQELQEIIEIELKNVK